MGRPGLGLRRMERQCAGGLGDWSRRIDNKHRFVYKVESDAVLIAQ